MFFIKKILIKIPIIGPALKISKHYFLHKSFKSSESYWEKRYETNGSSGDGSYNQLAEFKAITLNAFIEEKKIQSIIEFGSGDGNQLKMAKYADYIGFDVSHKAISICEEIFKNDQTKSFLHLSKWDENTKAELTMSLDVIYHLIEDDVYDDYMRKLFQTSDKWVVIYSSDIEEEHETRSFPHVKQRKFTQWIKKNLVNWKMLRKIENKYPYNLETNTGSISNFYFYEKL